MNQSISTFEKGIQKDTTKVNQPKGSYRGALNAVNVSEDGDYYALTNERGALAIAETIPVNYNTIGSTVLDTDIIVFLLNNTQTIFELGIIDKDNNYSQVFSCSNEIDIDSATDAQFSFSIDYPVQCVSRTLFDGSRMVYYTDNYQPFGVFNVDEILSLGTPTPRASKIIPDINLPKLEYNAVLNGSGQLTAGIYQVVIRYLGTNLVPTNYSIVSQPIPIVNESKGVGWEFFDGAVQGTITSKSIKMDVSNLDLLFPYYEVIVVRYANNTNTFQAFRVSTKNITSTTDSFLIDSISPEAVLITKEELRSLSITYSRAKTITQKDNRLFLANLTEDTARFDTELHNIANNMESFYEIEEFPHKTPDVDGNYTDYKNEEFTYKYKGYRRGEVYSFALVVLFKDGSESFAYHIPGNNRVLLGDGISHYVEDANTGTMKLGTYVSTEQYPATGDYLSVPDNYIRHHVMPSSSQEIHFRNVGGVEYIRVLGVKFKFNVPFSQELLDEIQDVYIYREMRDRPFKRRMVAQGIGTPLILTANEYYSKDNKDTTINGGDYKGAKVEGSEVYKKAPGFGGFGIWNLTYDGSGPASDYDTQYGNGMYLQPAGSNSDTVAATDQSTGLGLFTTKVCFHSPETQLANGVFIDESEFQGAYITSPGYLSSEISYTAKVAENISNTLGTRYAFKTFNSFKCLLDFNNFVSDGIGSNKEIFYSRRIEHNSSAFVSTPDLDNHPIDNTYSTPFVFLDIYNSLSPLDTLEISDTGKRLKFAEFGSTYIEFRLEDSGSARIPQADTHKTRLLNIKKELPSQYGLIDDAEYIPVNSVTANLNNLLAVYETDPIYNGDTFITKFGVTNKNVFKRVMPYSSFYFGVATESFSNGGVYNEAGTGSDTFFDTASSIDGALYRKGEEYHTLAYFFVESNINTEYRHEIQPEDNSEPVPYYPKRSFEEVITDPPENGDSTGYNTQYSFENNVRTVTPPSSYTQTVQKYNGRVIWSNLSNEDDRIDAYRIFNQFDKYDLPKNTGDIWNIFVHNNFFYTHTPKSLWRHFVNSISQQATDLGTVILGTGDLFTQPGIPMFTSLGGYGGCICQWGGIYTPFGYVFPDPLQGKIFILTDNLQEISTGMSQFFNNNLGIGLKDTESVVSPAKDYKYTDNPFNPNSAGITGVWDNELKRVIITKRGTDSDFTYSWSPVTKAWISEHSYKPHSYIARDNEVIAFDNNSNRIAFLHNRGNHGVFYDGTPQPFSINMILNEGALYEKSFDNINLHSLTIDNVGGFDNEETFKQIRVLNDYQDSGLIGLNTTNAFNPVITGDNVLVRWKKNHFQIAIPRDNQYLLDNSATQWTESSRMKSKYLDVEFIYPNGNLLDYKLTINFIEYLFRVISR